MKDYVILVVNVSLILSGVALGSDDSRATRTQMKQVPLMKATTSHVVKFTGFINDAIRPHSENKVTLICMMPPELTDSSQNHNPNL